MPVQKVKGGYKYGTKGKVYKKKSDAEKQGRAIRASQKRRKEKEEMICKVCGRYFRAKKEDRYEVTVSPVGLNVLTERTKTYECFDCPKCGCQNVVNIKEVDNSGDGDAG